VQTAERLDENALTAVAADPRLAQAWALLGSPGVAALSIDVFDTLLWRVVPEPAQAFVLLGRRLADAALLPKGVGPAAFARLRVQAERRARVAVERGRGGVECRLEEIWEQLERLALAAPLADYVEQEVALEAELCRPDVGVVALARLVGGTLGKQVRLVSDTYYSAQQLRRLLDRPEIAGVAIHDIAVSSEYGVNKSGGLFRASLLAGRLDPMQVVHLGDNEVADVEGATAAGVLAVHYEKGSKQLTRLLRDEQVVEVPLGDPRAVDEVWGDSGLTALRARAARSVDGDRMLPALRPFWLAGATVFGPAFTGFASWVHERAVAHGAAAVLCLMREGEFLDGLVKMAAPLAAKAVDSQPLWLSRQVCALASVTVGSREELGAFLVRRKPSSVAGLLFQLGVDPVLLPDLSGQLAAPLDAPFVADAVLEALSTVPQARAQLLATAREQREHLFAHLDRHLPADGPLVVVDVGWGGTIQALLARLLAERGTPREVIGLYLMTQSVAEVRRLDGLVLEGYLASGGEPAEFLDPLLRTPEILEQVTMCDEGTLLAFMPDGSIRTAEERMPRWQVSQREAVQSGIRAFQRLWLEAAVADPQRLALGGSHARLLMLRQLSRLVTRPTEEEAQAFGSWLHDDNFGDDATGAIVDPLTLDRARYSSPAGLAGLSMRDGYWPVGAARLVDPGLAAVAGLVSEGRLSPVAASSRSDLGKVTVYVDQGADFAAGAKEVLQPWAGPQGRVLVRSAQPVERAERVRFDVTARHGLIRVDRLRITVHTRAARQPYSVELAGDSLAGEARLLHGGRWLQPGVFEVLSEECWYAADLRVLCPPAVPRAYLVEVELHLAALLLPAGMLAVLAAEDHPQEVQPAVPAEPPSRPLWERAARRAVRELRTAHARGTG